MITVTLHFQAFLITIKFGKIYMNFILIYNEKITKKMLNNNKV